MSHHRTETQVAVILSPDEPPSASVIWLHGLGADGHDFAPIVEELQLPASTQVRFVFPHAEVRPVTINSGMRMRAWYDILSLGPVLSGSKGPDRSEDEAGVRASAQLVSGFIAAEVAAGVPEDRIALAGFSQGGAMALHTGLRHPRRLAGVLALSAYLPLASTLPAEASSANRGAPILMCHGLHDGLVPPGLGAAARDFLTSQGYRVEWRTYPMEHSVCMEEIADVSAWLQRIVSSEP